MHEPLDVDRRKLQAEDQFDRNRHAFIQGPVHPRTAPDADDVPLVELQIRGIQIRHGRHCLALPIHTLAAAVAGILAH